MLAQPKSFRFGPASLERLRRLTERLSEAAGRPITEIDALRGLLVLAEKVDEKKLVEALKDAIFESN